MLFSVKFVAELRNQLTATQFVRSFEIPASGIGRELARRSDQRVSRWFGPCGKNGRVPDGQKGVDGGTPPRHLLGSHTVLGISVPQEVNFALFMAYSFPINPRIPNILSFVLIPILTYF